MRKSYKLYIVIMVSILSSLCIIDNNTSALSYESSVGIGFTFNPTLSVSLSSNDLVIANLTPGSSNNSNSINVSVATNASYGYTLSANASNENLVHSNNTNTFSGITTNADLPSLDDSEDNNIWGYTTSLDNGSTWSNYNGLSGSSSTTLIDKDNNASSTIDFKIGAKASSTQASGVYTNTINFIAVTKPTPMNLAESYFAASKSRYKGYYTMQDMTTEICNNTEVIGEGSQTQLIDIRDDKVYWATKLADGHCWMTQNLDLDLDNTKPLTSNDTDLNDNSLTGAYTRNYNYDSATGTISWSPDNTTYHSSTGTGTAWATNNDKAYSLNPGDWYWNGNDATQNCNYLTTTCEDFSQTPYNTTGTHGHVGNYYNWSAAIASDNSNTIKESTYENITNNPKNSICPIGWRLPTISNQGNIEGSTNEFTRLNGLYNTTGDTGFISSPLYFVRAGQIGFNLVGSGSGGQCWSSTVDSYYYVYYLSFNRNGVDPIHHDYRRDGRSVRCIAR